MVLFAVSSIKEDKMSFTTLLIIIVAMLLVLKFVRATAKLMFTAAAIAAVVYVVLYVM